MSWRRSPPPASPPLDVRAIVLGAVCRVTEGKAGVEADIAEVTGYTAMHEFEVLQVIEVLEAEGVLTTDEEEEYATVALTEAGVQWAVEHHEEWSR